jgi:hypothetical protein
MPTIGRSASHAPRRIWSAATGALAQGGDRLLQRLAPPIPTYTRRPPSYNGVGGGRRYRVSSLGRSGRRPIPPDTPADRSTSLSLTQRLVRAPSAHRLGFSFLSGGLFRAGSMACDYRSFRREGADPLDKGCGRINNCCKQGRAFSGSTLEQRTPGACLSSAIAACIEDAGPGRARTCGIGGSMTTRQHGSVRTHPNGRQ